VCTSLALAYDRRTYYKRGMRKQRVKTGRTKNAKILEEEVGCQEDQGSYSLGETLKPDLERIYVIGILLPYCREKVGEEKRYNEVIKGRKR